MVSDLVFRKFGIAKNIGIGIKKIGIEKRIEFGIRKKLVSEKKFWIRFRSDFRYRHTLHLTYRDP